MKRLFNCFINVNGNLIPVFPIITDNSICDHPAYESLSLRNQVEIIANCLKREDYIQLILLKNRIDDGNLILKISELFKDEDVDVIGVYCEEITEDALNTIIKELKYGVIDGPKYVIEEPKTYKKVLH